MGILFVLMIAIINMAIIIGGTFCSAKDSGEQQQWDDLDNQLQQMQDEQNRHFMEESLKSVTPFEMGGYDLNQGNSWNNNFNDFNNGMF